MVESNLDDATREMEVSTESTQNKVVDKVDAETVKRRREDLSDESNEQPVKKIKEDNNAIANKTNGSKAHADKPEKKNIANAVS